MARATDSADIRVPRTMCLQLDPLKRARVFFAARGTDFETIAGYLLAFLMENRDYVRRGATAQPGDKQFEWPRSGAASAFEVYLDRVSAGRR